MANKKIIAELSYIDTNDNVTIIYPKIDIGKQFGYIDCGSFDERIVNDFRKMTVGDFEKLKVSEVEQ